MKKISNFKKFYLLNPYTNQEVTSVYCDIIVRSLETIGICVEKINSITKSRYNKKNGIIVVRTGDAWKAKRCHYGYIITWIQGVAPEETWLTLKNPIKYLYVLLLDILGFLSSNFIFYCSRMMKKHYRRRFLLLKKHSYTMPCFNEQIDPDFLKKKDYSKNIFVYAGGMDKWQCFQRTTEIYKKIEERIPNCVFHVFARDTETARAILVSNEIKNYTLDYVSPEQLRKELRSAKFGFCIRDNIEVNRVATPTKLSNYVSAGLIPIYSKCLDDFHLQSKDNKYSLCIDDKSFFDKLIALCSMNIDSEDLSRSFISYYGDYYSDKYHIERIVGRIKNYEK